MHIMLFLLSLRRLPWKTVGIKSAKIVQFWAQKFEKKKIIKIWSNDFKMMANMFDLKYDPPYPTHSRELEMLISVGSNPNFPNFEKSNFFHLYLLHSKLNFEPPEPAKNVWTLTMFKKV